MYLDGLAVVDFDYVEVKTVYPFTRRDEIAPLFVEIPAHVHENLRENERQLETLDYTLINASAFYSLELLSERRRRVKILFRSVVFSGMFSGVSAALRGCFALMASFLRGPPNFVQRKLMNISEEGSE